MTLGVRAPASRVLSTVSRDVIELFGTDLRERVAYFIGGAFA